MSYNALLLLGAPGSGKGTQGKILNTIPGFYHCASGDMFRAVDEESEDGRIFKTFLDKGQLVPDDATIKLWSCHMRKLEKSGRFVPKRDYLVLDGIPRTVHQAEMLKDYLTIHRVFHLDCRDRVELVKRLRNRALKENRNDDATVEVIERRLEIYDTQTKPVLDFYGKPMITEIDTSQAPHRVLHDILAVIPALNPE